jgi:hypothetical protein
MIEQRMQRSGVSRLERTWPDAGRPDRLTETNRRELNPHTKNFDTRSAARHKQMI